MGLDSRLKLTCDDIQYFYFECGHRWRYKLCVTNTLELPNEKALYQSLQKTIGGLGELHAHDAWALKWTPTNNRFVICMTDISDVKDVMDWCLRRQEYYQISPQLIPLGNDYSAMEKASQNVLWHYQVSVI